MSTNEAQVPFLVTLGCCFLKNEFMAQHYRVIDFGALEEMLSSTTEELPRVIVVRSTVIQSVSTESCLRQLKKKWPLVDVILWAPRCSAELVLGSMKAGARDVVLTESAADLYESIEQTLKNQRIQPRMMNRKTKRGAYKFEGIVSRDPKMWDVFNDIQRIAPTDASVLVLGETGTGKELVARAIHRLSGRKGRFVAVNCAAIPENLIDSELFGHVKGAFTGAHSEKLGLFRYAEGGTILLDEIGNMPLSAQYHLLRVLQEGQIRPVGGHREVGVDARVIAATSQPLDHHVAQGKLREDLLYRLDVVRLQIPPLRERGDDIVFVFSHFMQKFARQYRKAFPIMSDGFLDDLTKYQWPGNVRQMANIAERLILTTQSPKLTASHLRKVLKPTSTALVGTDFAERNDPDVNLNVPMKAAIAIAIDRWQRRYLLSQLERCSGNLSLTAAKSGINRRTVLRKLTAWNIDRSQYKKPMDP